MSTSATCLKGSQKSSKTKLLVLISHHSPGTYVHVPVDYLNLAQRFYCERSIGLVDIKTLMRTSHGLAHMTRANNSLFFTECKAQEVHGNNLKISGIDECHSPIPSSGVLPI